MESLRHICVKTEEAFKETNPNIEIGKLEKVVDEWLGCLKIRQFKIIPGNKLIIIAQEVLEQDSFSIFRFFPSSIDNWNVSVDLNDVRMEQVFEHLLTHYK